MAKDAKNVQLEPKLDPTWLQFGVKLAPSWHQVGPKLQPISCQMISKTVNCPNSKNLGNPLVFLGF